MKKKKESILSLRVSRLYPFTPSLCASDNDNRWALADGAGDRDENDATHACTTVVYFDIRAHGKIIISLPGPTFCRLCENPIFDFICRSTDAG